MDKLQALQAFWESFGWTAYNEATVPDNALTEHDGYVTYSAAVSAFESVTALTASLWQRSKSWTGVVEKAKEIETAFGDGWIILDCDDGRIWVKKGNPFYLLMPDEDNTVRRIYFNIEVEFFAN